MQQNHLAVMDAFPAIRATYFGVVGDPIQANGLPVSDVVDMGNHFALRSQRVVFQEWKEDVPWAQRGTVTVALGGDIAKEAGILPRPRCAPAYPARGLAAATYGDAERAGTGRGQRGAPGPGGAARPPRPLRPGRE